MQVTTMKLTKIATIGALAVSLAGLSACNNMMPKKRYGYESAYA